MTNKKLVAYFSATGVTKKLAQRLATSIDADLHEIVPQELYTEEDLDWTNKNSRSFVEMSVKVFRPEIANKVEDIASYNVIFIGFPIWWKVAPTIVNTFLEDYNLTGKTIVPFATSGGSPMGNTNDELLISCSGVHLVEGRLFSPTVNDAELKSWAEQF